MHPLPHSGNVVQGEKYRITVLTDRLFRFEYSESGQFEDRATQIVWFRDLGEVSYTVRRTEYALELETDALILRYDEQKFSTAGLSAKLKGAPRECDPEWFYGRKSKNLKGTARTLDEADGAVELSDGILATDGFAVLDDSETIALTQDGWIAPRQEEEDFYLFAYAHDYRGALRDYYRLTGRTPMLPRYALGNWWSRYYEYTQESYQELMKRFDEEKVPFSVAVIDMDWHLVNIDPKYGDGWTGYTWNRELFPDPKAFLEWLHERGMKTTLNIHPASGVRAYEEAYPEVARAMGIDPETGETVPFDVTNCRFIRAYFEKLLHPLEEEGVDFWWIDWQQGTHTRIPHLDPLWMLNHYHFLDSGRKGDRPMTFSRYAGPGSHRYPIGFSGDSVISWDSLQFQPYFTATASNIGYGWWSHDIGGHMLGEKSDTMQVRWVQLGVFSPIMRLHSSKCEFSGKEPWNYRPEAREAVDEFLRLRHRLIPYLYTMNRRAYEEGEPIVEPMYYRYPEEPGAYPARVYIWDGHPNQYFFGSEMIAAPITTDLIASVHMGKTQVWIPEGIWHDFFTGLRYQGGRCMDLYRPLASIPVLVRAGGIVPMTQEIFGRAPEQNPASLEIRMYGGANGSFTLYEDDGASEDYRSDVCVRTRFELDWDHSEVVLRAAEGELTLIPQARSYTVCLMGVRENVPHVTSGGEKLQVSVSYESMMGCLRISLPETAVTEEIRIGFAEPLTLNDNHEKERLFALLNQAQTDNPSKENAYAAYLQAQDKAAALTQMRAVGLEEEIYGAAAEIIAAGSR